MLFRSVGDQFHNGRINGVNPDFETAQEPLAAFAPSKARLDVLKMSEHRPEECFDEVSRAYFVCVRKSVARGGQDLEAAQSRCFESKPVANVVETDGMGKLGKNHCSHVAQDAEGTCFCVHAGFLGCLIEKTSGDEVEKLLENDNV